MKVFTSEKVMEILKEEDMTARQVSNNLNCSIQTANGLLNELLLTKRITKKNISTEKRPQWLYSSNGKGSV